MLGFSVLCAEKQIQQIHHCLPWATTLNVFVGCSCVRVLHKVTFVQFSNILELNIPDLLSIIIITTTYTVITLSLVCILFSMYVLFSIV